MASRQSPARATGDTSRSDVCPLCASAPHTTAVYPDTHVVWLICDQCDHVWCRALRPESEAQAHTGKTILIVEDDADLRRMLRVVLTLAGFEVREARDGHHALRSVDQHAPDLVVFDLGLPLLDGLSVREEIAAQALTRTLPVVIVAGEERDLSDVNVACILRKPVSPEDVVSAVRRCLHRGSVAMASRLPTGPADSPRIPAWRA